MWWRPWALEADRVGSDPSSTTGWPCHFGQVTSHLCTSVTLSVWGVMIITSPQGCDERGLLRGKFLSQECHHPQGEGAGVGPSGFGSLPSRGGPGSSESSTGTSWDIAGDLVHWLSPSLPRGLYPKEREASSRHLGILARVLTAQAERLELRVATEK